MWVGLGCKQYDYPWDCSLIVHACWKWMACCMLLLNIFFTFVRCDLNVLIWKARLYFFCECQKEKETVVDQSLVTWNIVHFENCRYWEITLASLCLLQMGTQLTRQDVVHTFAVLSELANASHKDGSSSYTASCSWSHTVLYLQDMQTEKNDCNNFETIIYLMLMLFKMYCVNLNIGCYQSHKYHHSLILKWGWNLKPVLSNNSDNIGCTCCVQSWAVGSE
jgi:hypothetical protein